MQWRQILFSFAILFGSALWALPSSALASDFCVADPSSSSQACPGTSKFSDACKKSNGDFLCLSTVVGSAYEHCCQSSVDPCIKGIEITGSACSSGKSKINSCGTKIVCIESSLLTAPPIAVTTDALCKNSGNNGVCMPIGGCVAPKPNKIGTCDTSATPDCCSANITAANVLANDVTTTVKNPLSFSTVEGVLGSLLGALQGIIVVLSLVFILVGAFFYITSAGDDGRMKTAKGAITASAIGLALGLAAPSFLKQISTILGWTAVTDCTAGTPPPTAIDIANCQAAQATLNAGKPLSTIALNTLQFLLSIVGVLGIIMLVVGGIVYITASGDEDRIDTGKKIVKYAIIGIAIALASLVAVTQIAALFIP